MYKTKTYQHIIIFCVFAIAIYLYFFTAGVSTIFGDDLVLYREHITTKDFFVRLNVARTGEKFRPVSGIAVNFLIDFCKKSLFKYFIFNAGVQVINTYIFFRVLNLFLRSAYFAAFVSLVFGLSRFVLYDIAQIFCGGPLEGLAMTFFLLSLYYISRFFIDDQNSAKQNYKYLLYCIIFSNLAIYTHERYITVFPFIMLCALFFPSENKLTVKRKYFICFLSVFSVVFNVAIKKYCFHYAFLVGTNGTHIEFSFASMYKYLSYAVLSILQVNSVGSSYSEVSLFYRSVIGLMLLLLAMIVLLFSVSVYRNIKLKQKNGVKSLYAFMLLLSLLGLSLIPAIVTIRLETRWLQAPLCIFILLAVVVFCNIFVVRTKIKYSFFIAFVSLFLITGFNYYKPAFANMKGGENIACSFKQAAYNGTIPQSIDTLYIMEDNKRDYGFEGWIGWIIGNGYFFNYYQGKSKEVIYINAPKYADSTDAHLLKDFNKRTAEIIVVKDKIEDVTDQYFEDKRKIPASDNK